MKVGYYPGCSLEGTAKDYERSLKVVLAKLEITPDEINDWSCCGASSAHVTNHTLAVALPAYNLMLAKNQGMKDIFAPCAACYNRLISAQYELAANPKMRQKIELILEEQYSNGMEIINAVQLFYKYGLEKIKEKVVKKLDNMKIACYYGCLLTRPNEITKFDDAEHPTSMEKLVEITGAKTIEWNFKVECCGASHSIARTEIVESLSKKILDDALKHGANAIVVACPMCHSNLDMRQLTMKKHNDDHQEVPVYYLSELLGLALGIEPKALGIDLHFIDAMKF